MDGEATVAPLAARAASVATEVAAVAADDVDRRARFPKEALDALAAERLLGAMVPTELGGESASLADLCEATTVLSRACASTGMVFAMHQIQVACLVHHGRDEAQRAYLRDEVVGRQALLASATTEVGIGGDVRSSSCAVESDGDGFSLTKQAPVISYGDYADAVLATARRTPDSPPNDQVLVLCRPPELTLEPTSEWDTLGFRGTCSRGFLLRAKGPRSAVLPVPYAEISASTMLPTSHLLWSSVWLGLASAAVGQARAYVRALARRRPGTTPPAALRLAELVPMQQAFSGLVERALRRYEAARADGGDLDSLEFAIEMNGLKVETSNLVREIALRALSVCGIEGYREDSPFTLGRILRDACGASLMVSNDRILDHSAQLLLVSKEDA